MVDPTGQPLEENGWPVGPEGSSLSPRSPGRCPGLGERLPLWGKRHVRLWGEKLLCLHRDERGSISILAVFTAVLLTMLLGMVLNVGREVDGKIRLQNAADAAAYSGGLTLTRGMNSLVFTNHMMCEIIAMTAILREASNPAEFPRYDGQLAARQVPEILAAWNKAAALLKRAPFEKYRQLGVQLEIHLQHEREFVTVFTAWAAAFSSEILPVLEFILENELLPEYQRNLVVVYPRMAQAAALDAARRNAEPAYGREEMHAALWRWNGQLAGDPLNELGYATIPAIDPVRSTLPDQPLYLEEARNQRNLLAREYLHQWNNHIFWGMDLLIPFSKFKELWFKITCGRLEQLLDENHERNLPFQIRKMVYAFDQGTEYNLSLKDNYTFLGVVYWKPVPRMMPRIFSSATESDSVAYAEVHLFVPKPRLVWARTTWPPSSSGESTFFGTLEEASVPGNSISFWQVVRQHAEYFPANWGPNILPENWNLYNQNWICQLAPATQEGLVDILQHPPYMPYVEPIGDINMPMLGELQSEDIERISPH